MRVARIPSQTEHVRLGFFIRRETRIYRFWESRDTLRNLE